MGEKLKNLFRPKSLDYILSDRKTRLKKIEQDNAYLESCYGKHSMLEWDALDDKTKQILHAITDCIIYDQLMHELKSKDRKYYEELSQNMNINKEEAEIDVKYLEKLFPIITGINSALKIYSNYHS